MVPLLQRRLFCNKSFHQNHRQWPIKQVTKSNFDDSLSEIKQRISTSDFVAVFLQNTGSFSSPWQRVSAFDTPDTAYSKAKSAAERFQTLQFAVCPFTLQASKLTAYPYNFHLFPRDEHKLGMPSYSFTCQTSSLTSMAREGFDFNACIYDGISYLSRAQEYAAKVRIGIPMPVDHKTKSSSPTTTVADTVFVERIRTRVRHWKNACTDISTTKLEDAFVRSLRTIVLGSEKYGSRPSITIDVCSERQVQLVLEMLEQSDNLVPLLVPAKSGGIQSVRAVLTSSQEDKNLLKMELQNLEVNQTKRVRGFREVIDLISASQKPVVSYNSLNDFTFIHSKFIAPLPPTVDEFTNSLHLAFPVVLDVNHLVKNIVPVKKTTNISATMTYLKNRFVTPVDMEIPHEDVVNEGNNHGHKVVKICHLFGKLCSVLKITPSAIQSGNHHLASSALQGYENVFKLCPNIPQESTDEDIRIWTNNTRKVSCQNVVFLWGFKKGTTAGTLKSLLQGSHEVFTEEFDLRSVDRSCAIVVFWQPGSSQTFLDIMNGKDFSGKLMEMVSEGVRASGYEAYKRVCSSGLWESELADSLDKALAISECISESDSESKPSEIYWCNELMINLDDL